MTRHRVAERVIAGVVVGVDAGDVRRRVGPTAWCVLEAIAASADSQSVRSLAVELGVGKNAVHRALGVLRVSSRRSRSLVTAAGSVPADTG